MTNASATTGVVYDSTVTAVGGQVEAFIDHGMLIFFADDSPAELHDISVRHHATVTEDGPRPGDTIYLGDIGLEILAVGKVVAENLLRLGHLDLKADGLTTPKLPGDVCVAQQTLPSLATGDAFRIVRGKPHMTEELQ